MGGSRPCWASPSSPWPRQPRTSGPSGILFGPGDRFAGRPDGIRAKSGRPSVPVVVKKRFVPARLGVGVAVPFVEAAGGDAVPSILNAVSGHSLGRHEQRGADSSSPQLGAT
ncbi:MAG: hypothetical protein QOG46_92 [Pseudonocardiales bacterium]|nr:hypothetical protein [Pseudonocardiales bacterium]